MQLTVTILDVNDFTPKFVLQSYVKSMVEDTTALGDAEDRRILTISAKDDDEGDNAKVLYNIILGNEEGLLELSSGQLSLFDQPLFATIKTLEGQCVSC